MLFPVGTYEFGMNCLRVDTFNVMYLLGKFTPGNFLCATLNPYLKTPGYNGVDSYMKICDTPDTLFLYTSGTTGTPKKVEKKNMSEFLATKKGNGSDKDTWILTYHPYRWAGITLLAHTIKHCSKLAVPETLEPEKILQMALGSCATHISLTPSMFRQMLITQPALLQDCSFQQITFGGEYANQALLDQAKNLFPEARISHAYASTEAGDICAVSDGLEGYPVSRFPKQTDDMWEQRGDRMFFVGRSNDVVNVGGDKISLSYVENKMTSIYGVQLARAKAEPSPLLGNIITVDYVGVVEPREVMKAAREILPKYAVAKVFKVDSIELSGAGKIKR